MWNAPAPTATSSVSTAWRGVQPEHKAMQLRAAVPRRAAPCRGAVARARSPGYYSAFRYATPPRETQQPPVV